MRKRPTFAFGARIHGLTPTERISLKRSELASQFSNRNLFRFGAEIIILKWALYAGPTVWISHEMPFLGKKVQNDSESSVFIHEAAREADRAAAAGQSHASNAGVLLARLFLDLS